MKSHATFVPSFLVFIFYVPISDVQPFHVQRSYQDERRRITDDDPVFRSGINWSGINHQRLHLVTSFDMNRGYLPPLPLPSFSIERTERSETYFVKRADKRKCVHGFCEEVDDYPEDLIKNVLKRSNSLDDYFKEAEVTFDLNNRGAFDEEEDINDTLCPVRSVTRYPRTARNTKQEDKILINVEGHRQGIVFETCIEDVKTCKFSESFPTGYVSSCKQKYVKRRLATLDGDNETTSWDTFEVPSCCVCIIKRE